MPGILRSPTDMSAPPMIGAPLSPPIIPHRTSIPPGAMRALLRQEMGLEDELEEDGRPSAAVSEPPTEQSLLAEFGNLFWKAGEYPGLQDVMLSFVKALKQAADQQHAVSEQTLLRPPTPITSPDEMEAAPRDALRPPMMGP
jgi:hypothetical protein